MGRKSRKQRGKGKVRQLEPAKFVKEDNSDTLFQKWLEEESATLVPKEQELGEEGILDEFSPRTGQPTPYLLTIDLHGLTLDQAQAQVRLEVDRALAGGGSIHVKVITGRGLRSGPQGSILVHTMYDFFKAHYTDHIRKISSNPAETTIGGLPLRGHFEALLD